MKSNTALDQVSSEVPNSATLTEAEVMANRTATIAKATTRIVEVHERIALICRALKSTMPEFIGQHPLGDVVDAVAQLDTVVDELDKATKEANGVIAYAREVSMPARLDAEQAKTFTSDTGTRVTRTIRTLASIISDTTGETFKRACEWLRKNEYEALIKETVNSSSLSAAAKELLENGKELPDDIFKVHYKDGVSITKPKKK